VQHASLGVGKIVALEISAVHVFFPSADKRFAAKLRLPAARAMLRTDGFEPDAWLAGLTAFSLDETSGRYALAASWLTHEQALAQFQDLLPGGFAAPEADAQGRPSRASRWRAAHELMAKKLGDAELERLVAGDELKTLTSRAVEIDKAIASLHLPADVGAVKAALSDPETAAPFFAALAELVATPAAGRARFDKLFAAARALPVEPAQQWLMATLFPFLAAPDKHVLLRPRSTCPAAERLGSDLRYEPIPTWVTYAALRAVEVRLLERLAPSGAADFIDVETFLHVTATARKVSPTGEKAVRTAKPRAVKRATP
jgi:hypothetical protein